MPYWFPDLATVVTAAPGTGSTSLTTACAGAEGAVDLLARLGHHRTSGLDSKHATFTDICAAGLFDAGDVRDVLSATRNPYHFYLAEWHRTRTRWAAELSDASSWVHRVPGMTERIKLAVGHDFAPWLRLELAGDLERGAERRLNAGHVNEATIVLRMEHLQDDLNRLHPGLAERIGRVGQENRTLGAPAPGEAYTDWGREAVEALHAADLTRFGYSFP